MQSFLKELNLLSSEIKKKTLKKYVKHFLKKI